MDKTTEPSAAVFWRLAEGGYSPADIAEDLEYREAVTREEMSGPEENQ